jgi:hypothetical protein
MQRMLRWMTSGETGTPARLLISLPTIALLFVPSMSCLGSWIDTRIACDRTTEGWINRIISCHLCYHYLTTTSRPEVIWHTRTDEAMAQLLRRVTSVVEFTSTEEEVVHKSDDKKSTTLLIRICSKEEISHSFCYVSCWTPTKHYILNKKYFLVNTLIRICIYLTTTYSC